MRASCGERVGASETVLCVRRVGVYREARTGAARAAREPVRVVEGKSPVVRDSVGARTNAVAARAPHPRGARRVASFRDIRSGGPFVLGVGRGHVAWAVGGFHVEI